MKTTILQTLGRVQRHEGDPATTSIDLIGIVNQRDLFEKLTQATFGVLSIESVSGCQQLRKVGEANLSVRHAREIILKATSCNDLIEDCPHGHGADASHQLPQPGVEIRSEEHTSEL